MDNIKYRTANEIYSGEVCAVTGLTKTYSGENLGIENDNNDVILEPVLMYRVVLPQEIDAAMMLPKLKQLEEEDPTLAIKWNEDLKDVGNTNDSTVFQCVCRNHLSDKPDWKIWFPE